MIRKLAGLLAVFATLALAGCGYNDLQRQDEGIKAAWSEVLNQYQRRADLVPNLVNTVKGYAAQEAEGADRGDQRARERRRHQGHAGARQRSRRRSRNSSRRRASSPARCRGFSSSPRTIRNSSPTRCSATCTAQLEGTENRITVARNRYIKSVQEYNTTVRSVPDQPHGDGVQDGREAQLHGRERGRDQRAAEGRLQQAAGGARGPAAPRRRRPPRRAERRGRAGRRRPARA